MRMFVGWIAAVTIFSSPCGAISAPYLDQSVPVAPGQVLSAAKRRQVDRSVDRALAWLVAGQASNGSFPARPQGQPGITSLCAQALLTRGHLPGTGPYGRSLDKAIVYMLSCQRPSGLISRMPPEPRLVPLGASRAGMYSHAVTGVVLCEVYGMTDLRTSARIGAVIEKALAFTRRKQTEPKRDPVSQGGWRYLRPKPRGAGSDLCVTAWQLMFLRAARNAGFQVPEEQIDEAMSFVRGCFVPGRGTFNYIHPSWRYHRMTPAMAGSGILSFALAGRHNSLVAQSTGRWVLRTDFDNPSRSWFFYGGYYCSQAMFQLGGEHWRRFYPRLSRALLSCQRTDGSWGPNWKDDRIWGKAFTTAVGAQALMVPYQLLPIYQR